MAKQHISIFKALGIPQDKIDAIEAIKDDDKDFKPDETVELVNTTMRTKLSNDQTFLDSIDENKIPAKFKKAIESQQYARFLNELMDTYTKDFKLDPKDLTEEDKKSIRKMAEKMTTLHFTKNNNVEGMQKMQHELSEAKQALTKKDEEYQTKLNDELSKGTEKYSQKLIRTLAQTYLGSLDKIKLNVAPDYIVDRVLQKMGTKAKVILGPNEDGLILKQKDNDKLEYLDEKTGKPISFNDLARVVVLEDKIGLEVKEGGGPGLKKKVVVDTGDGGGEGDAVEVPGYIEAEINKNIALESK